MVDPRQDLASNPHGDRARRVKIQQLGRSAVRQLHAALRTIRIHDASNNAVVASVGVLREAINSLWGILGGVVRIQFVEDVVFVNDHRLRVNAVIADQVDALRTLLAEREIGGISFGRPVTPQSLTAFLVPLSKSVEDEEAPLRLRLALRNLGDLGIDVLEPQKLLDEETYDTVRVNRLEFALQTYARAIVAFREAVDAMKAGNDPLTGRVHITRVVQDMVDIATERVNFLLKIPALKRANAKAMDAAAWDYDSNHAANTCVYALLIGKFLGLDRLELLDLGTSALLADIGFALLPKGLTGRSSELDERQCAELKGAMVRASQALLGQGRISDAMMRRLIVANEHHATFIDPKTGEASGMHLFSRIVAVCDAYDALTSDRPWRGALSAADALDVLRREAGLRYDSTIVAVLVAVLKTYGAHSYFGSVAPPPPDPATRVADVIPPAATGAVPPLVAGTGIPAASTGAGAIPPEVPGSR